jgi:hypothetical protein
MMESAVYGVDVGKISHYALAVDGAGKPIYQTGVPNDEAALSKLVDWAKGPSGRRASRRTIPAFFPGRVPSTENISGPMGYCWRKRSRATLRRRCR